jgi:DHA1 family bicyclomycin/chloramphenicol resistance-like MFS transporter
VLRHRLELIVILGALTAFAPLSVDMYLPSLPTLEGVFDASTAAVQRTLATFFLGFALGQALYGPITDRYGRKPPLYASIGLFVAASIGCALAPSIGALAGLRFVQAVGAGAGAVIARAMVRDQFTHEEAPRGYAALMLVMGAAPMLAPLIGGYVLVTLGWSAIFWALAGFGLLCLAAVHFRLEETHHGEAARSLALMHILAGYGRLLCDRRFLGYALTGGLSIAGMFAYIAGSPFVFIALHEVPPEQFGWFFGANAMGLIAASQLNGVLLRRSSPDGVLRAANAVQAVAGILLLATAATGIGGLAGIAAALFVYVGCLGFILPNTTAMAMAPHGRAAGTASALMGTLQFSIAAVAATLVGMADDGTAVPMAAIIAAAGLLGVAVSRLLTTPAPDR